MKHTIKANFTYIIIIIIFYIFSITKSDSIEDVTGIMVAMLQTNYFYFLYLYTSMHLRNVYLKILLVFWLSFIFFYNFFILYRFFIESISYTI